MPSNTAVWLPAKQAAFTVGPAPYPTASQNELIVRNRAVAINPVDWLMQPVGDFVCPWLKYPFIPGTDVAGEVVEVGPGVTRFKLGDRVLGLGLGGDKERNSAAEGAFQEYTVLLEHMTCPIPDDTSFESASVLPLGVSTAACGLFQKDHLALQYPSATAGPTGQTVLIWGGSTSVGSNAIQLAVAAGYDVITTASPKNFDYAIALGAGQVFDYHSPTVVRDIVGALKGKTLAGALAIGLGSPELCVDVVKACKGGKFVSLASTSVSFDTVPIGRSRTPWLIATLPRLLASNVALALTTQLAGIRTKFIFGSTLAWNDVGSAIFVDFLPDALATKRYVAAPEPLVVGHGIEHILTGLAAQRKGVSARKVVVSL